jgi:hypothetical protein
MMKVFSNLRRYIYLIDHKTLFYFGIYLMYICLFIFYDSLYNYKLLYIGFIVFLLFNLFLKIKKSGLNKNKHHFFIIKILDKIVRYLLVLF